MKPQHIIVVSTGYTLKKESLFKNNVRKQIITLLAIRL